MKAIDNSRLARQSDVIFANGTGYHVELRMAGRAEETAILQNALRATGSPRLVTVQAPLGAGKTFFLNTVLGRFARDTGGFEERRNCQYVLATSLDEEIAEDGSDITLDSVGSELATRLASEYDKKFAEVGGLYVLIVEELDRKATLGQILWSVAAAIAWLQKGGDRLLLLTGDATIANPRLVEFVTLVGNRASIELEPLATALLIDALEVRILDKLITPELNGLASAEGQEIARLAAEQLLSSDVVNWAAVPHADPNRLATFREALGALRQMAAIAPSSDGRIVFDAELVRAVAQEPVAPAGAAGDLEQALHDYVIGRIQTGAVLEPITMDMLAAMVEADVSETGRKRRFRQRGVEAVARLGLMAPLGIPYSAWDENDEEPLAIVEPFLPSYRLVHRALAELHG
jgi:hypothetical protein